MKKKEYLSPVTEYMFCSVPQSICGSKAADAEDWTTENEYNLFD